ncbi:hypothetical protein R3P38DRAFT_3200448 [Favolaschia claudopus]|uniref:DUF6535 domain-containing protein n=1 Tax=Favolaschia claudopus TaxID=2862362 RepID=A0AAW0B0I4_9AGAR
MARDVAQTISQPPVTSDPDADSHAAGIWSVYVSEAEKYDKSLVESWKSDMEGMLIFAGLFSASLTAFLVESYKSLNSDSSDDTVRLLNQISQQLAASAKGTTFDIPPTPSFAPPASALACNMFWFISLSLSLSCALIATLVEQWARDFIHRTEIHSAPVLRARIFSFLYYGLKGFNMHVVVELLPLLLHTSLMLFFAGLVAFLVPVSIPLAAATTTMLVIIIALYIFLTVLPLQYLNSPYRTPLSGILWRVLRTFRSVWRFQFPLGKSDDSSTMKNDDETFFEAITRHATVASADRFNRDRQALFWTVKSLSDERELELFVRGVPNTLWGPEFPRHAYTPHFRRLVLDPEINLYGRIQALLRSCQSSLLTPEASEHRQIVCLQALWAITSLFTGPPHCAPSWLSIPLAMYYADFVHRGQSDLAHYAVSAVSLAHWVALCPLEGFYQDLLVAERIMARGNVPDMTSIHNFMTSWQSLGLSWLFTGENLELQSAHSARLVPRLIQDVGRVATSQPWDIRLRYIAEAAQLKSPPYYYYQTLAMLTPRRPCPGARFDINTTLCGVVEEQIRTANGANEGRHDRTVQVLLSDWLSQEVSGSLLDFPAFIKYLRIRRSDVAVTHVISGQSRLWPAFAQSLVSGVLDINNRLDTGANLRMGSDVEDLLFVLWRCCSLGFEFPETFDDSILFQASIEALTSLNQHRLVPSILILLKFRYLAALHEADTLSSDAASLTLDPESIAESMVVYSPQPGSAEDLLKARIMGAKVYHLAQFLENCQCIQENSTIYEKAIETLKYLKTVLLYSGVHVSHQKRLAKAIRTVFSTKRPHPQFQTAFIDMAIFDVYAAAEASSQADITAYWLTDESVRIEIKEVFAKFVEKLKSHASHTNPTMTRTKAIMAGLNRHKGAFLYFLVFPEVCYW